MKELFCKCGKTILVDDEDFEALSSILWECLSSAGGIVRSNTSSVPITHLIKGEPLIKMMWDHIDLNHHNNQKTNLRLANRNQNNHNRLAYGKFKCKGVKRHQGKWMARITINYKEIYLGVFDEKLEAAEAYNKAAINHYGEFAQINDLEVLRQESKTLLDSIA